MGRRRSGRTRQEVLCRSPQAMPARRKGLGRPCPHPASSETEPGCSPRMQLVYVNTFGSHRCGSVIRYSRGCRQAGEGRQAGPPSSQLSPTLEVRGQKATPAPGHKGSPGLPAADGKVEAVRSCGVVKAVSRHQGDLQEAKADPFDFPFPSRNVDKVIKRKKQKSKVWRKVWKVISKMLEENEKFRSRLLTCSQVNGEGNVMNQSSQNEASYLDREESIFGWV